MLNVHELEAQDLHGLSLGSLAELAAQMLQHIGQQSRQIASQAQAIRFKDAKIGKRSIDCVLPPEPPTSSVP